jgi:hypothetical protein
MFHFQYTNLNMLSYNFTIALPSRTVGNRLKKDINKKSPDFHQDFQIILSYYYNLATNLVNLDFKFDALLA